MNAVFKSPRKVNSITSSESKRLGDWPIALLNKKQHAKARSAYFVFPFKNEMYQGKSVEMIKVIW
ncbi:MAG: hypothetical protein ACFE9R_05140 [Candidatus Hermodarchaeota archaeon]